MIKTLSSYYINIPLVSPLTSLTCESLVIKLYIWQGLITDVPTATYTLTENNPEALTTNLNVNISKLINDFIDFKPQILVSNIQDGNNQIWCKQEVFYNTSNPGEANTAQLVDTNLCIKGYGYAMEGLNPQPPTDKILLTNREFKVSKTSKFIVPIIIEQSPLPTPNITITNVVQAVPASNFYEIDFTTVGNYSSFYAVITPLVGVPWITPDFGVVSPQGIVIPLTGDLEIEMYGFDNSTSQNVISNTFNITI